MAAAAYVRAFEELGLADVPLVGGKNASLGELYRVLLAQGVQVPNGFAVTADAYRDALTVSAPSPAGTGFKPFQIEALEILIAWGERRAEALELVEFACRKHPDISTAEALVPLVYRLKQGVEV